MTALFAKLNLKDKREILVMEAPASFETELKLLDGVQVHRTADRLKQIGFALAFVQTLDAVKAAAEAIDAKAQGDVVLWMVYPKQSSRKYRCEFHRDTGWEVLSGLGYESVRMVAVDEDWSALRFRKTEFVGR